MRSTMAARTMPVSAVAVEEASPGHWEVPRIVEAARAAPSRTDSAPRNELAPARGIGLAVLAGSFMWAGLGWIVATIAARFA